jgi:hypothetical protein
MPQISRPFSFPGRTRISHRKRNPGGLAASVRNPAAELHRHRRWIWPDLPRPRHRLCVRRDRARQSFADPPSLDVPAWSGAEQSSSISTSYAERSNLNIRMHTRRFTRLTNAFSRKVENHAHSVALFALNYNFVRIHKTLRTTPAMAANVTKRLWEIGDIVDVLEAWENTT